LGIETIKALEKHLDLQSFEKDIAGDRWQDQGLIFTSTIGTPFEQKKLHDQYKKLLGDSGLSDIRFHDLRHTAATLMLLNGIPVIVVSKRLGHAKVSTTLDIYGHYMPGMQDEAANLMDSLVIPTAADCSRVPTD